MVMQEYMFDFVARYWSVLLCSITLLWYFISYTTKRPDNFPPGPRGFPILGVAPLVGRRPEITFANWGKTYGDIIGFKMGSNYTVVLNSYDAIQEALVKKAAVFNNRPDNFIFSDIMRKKGVTMNDYTPEYIIERKFAHTTLSRLGFGKRSLEGPVIKEAEHLLEEFGDKDVELNEETKRLFLYAAGNTIAQVSIGKRYEDYRDPELKKIMDGFGDFFRTGSLAYMATMIFPWFRRIPPIRDSGRAIKRGLDQVSEVMKKQISEHEESLDETDPRDFMDAYLTEMNKNGDTNNGLYSKDMLDCMIRDFFGAGTETITSTTIFTCLVLANRPEMMKRVHDEIDDIIGKDGEIRYALREKMPFCHAFIKEILRYRTLGPLCIPHCTSENTTLRGFKIPKGTTVLPNIYAVHNDPRNWDNPDQFNPERHIDKEGRLNVSKYFMPFGYGPRLCIGRRLAEMEVFIFFVTIFRRYSATPMATANGERPVLIEDSEFTGLTLCPPDNTPVKLVRRKLK